MVKQRQFRKLFFISLMLHTLVLGVLIMSFEFNSRSFVLENADKNNEIMNAVVMDTSKIQMPHPSPLPPPEVKEAPKKVKPPAPQPKQEMKALPEVKKQVEPVVQKKTIAIPDKRKKQLQKDLIHKQLLEDLKKETELQKKTKQKDLEKAFEKELKAQAAKSLQQQLLKEKSRVAAVASAAETQKMRGIVDKYKALILQAIGQHWLVPNGVDKSLSSELMIRVAPGGMVLDVRLVRSSGDSGLDSSARKAVFKASPLPVPSDPEEFEPFRQFILKVKPENVLAQDVGLS